VSHTIETTQRWLIATQPNIEHVSWSSSCGFVCRYPRHDGRISRFSFGNQVDISSKMGHKRVTCVLHFCNPNISGRGVSPFLKHFLRELKTKTQEHISDPIVANFRRSDVSCLKHFRADLQSEEGASRVYSSNRRSHCLYRHVHCLNRPVARISSGSQKSPPLLQKPALCPVSHCIVSR
jgi:hypothetical protein